MLSLFNIKTGAAAASYYESADDYYSKDGCDSEWWGACAKKLGLSGLVEHNVFAQILEGNLPNGQQLQNAAAGRRGGTDATLSAPKTVSLQALVGGDRRVLLAHRLAVSRALGFVEQFAACRVTLNGETKSERTGALLVARFEHDLSRTCDPQVHTHCLFFNATLRQDGEWRALDNQFLYRRKMLLGAFYRAELARELQSLGYGIRVTKLDGSFELAHIDDNQVKAFSKRSSEIEDFLKQEGLTRKDASAELKKLAALSTRQKKTQVDREMLLDDWKSLCAANRINFQASHQYSGIQPDAGLADEFVREACRHLTERQAVIDHVSLLAAVLAMGVGRFVFADAEVAIERSVESGSLIRVGERYTTAEMLSLEAEILDLEKAGRRSVPSIFEGRQADLQAQLNSLSEGQRKAAMGIVISDNLVTGVQGRAGVGKTTLLREAAEISKKSGYKVLGLAPSASAAKELSYAGIQAETISAFIARIDKRLSRKTLLVVDEAGMVSTRQMHSILHAVSKANCRLVLVGDTAQLQAVEAGKPFAQLQAAGMHTSEVSEIQRQKNAKLKHAVELSVDGRVGMAIELIDKSILQLEDAKVRFERIASDYCALKPEDREQTLLVAGTRRARNEINQQVREKLGFDLEGHKFILLDRKDLTKSQQRSTLAYEPGDIVIAEASFKTLGLKRGHSAEVIARRDADILLRRADGVEVAWRPAQSTNLTAYVPVLQELSIGELVKVTSNHREHGLVNGDLCRISKLSIDDQTMTLAMHDGREVILDTSRPLPLALGYCSTIHSSQGQTCDRVLIEADAYSLTSNQNSWYVAISRARQAVTVYTDDREMLPLAMSRVLDKETALALVKSSASHEMELSHD